MLSQSSANLEGNDSDQALRDAVENETLWAIIKL